VGEAGVGHGQAEQVGPEQQHGGAADTDPGHHHEHDRGQDDVPGRVGEGDRLLQDPALAGPEHRPQHQRPAGEQQRGGDHGPVEQRPRLEGGPLGPAREGQHGRRGQGDGGQVADAARDGKQLALGQVLVHTQVACPTAQEPAEAASRAQARLVRPDPDTAQALLAAASSGPTSWARLAVSLTCSSATGRIARNTRKAPTASPGASWNRYLRRISSPPSPLLIGRSGRGMEG
jgi:hypothetical protein